jgi:hypothetical protein
MVNPSHEKRLRVVARLAEELRMRRPDIPMLVIESADPAACWCRRGWPAGYLMMAAASSPKDCTGKRRPAFGERPRGPA